MSLINMKEVDLIQEWAKEHENENIFNDHFSHLMQTDSYFCDVQDEESYIMEYEFDNVRELEEMFQKYWGNNTDSFIRKVAAVSAFKYKAKISQDALKNENKESQLSESTSKLPEYIYVF